MAILTYGQVKDKASTLRAMGFSVALILLTTTNSGY